MDSLSIVKGTVPLTTLVIIDLPIIELRNKYKTALFITESYFILSINKFIPRDTGLFKEGIKYVISCGIVTPEINAKTIRKKD